MPRAKSDQIITHRIEMGKWERDQITPVIQMGTFAGSIGVVGAGAGIALAAYGLYWFFDAAYGIKDDIKSWWKSRPAAIEQTNRELHTPKEDWDPVRQAFDGPGILWDMLFN